MTYISEFLTFGKGNIYDTKKYGKTDYIKNLPPMTYEDLFYKHYIKLIRYEMRKHGIKNIKTKDIINNEYDLYDYGIAEKHFFTYN